MSGLAIGDHIYVTIKEATDFRFSPELPFPLLNLTMHLIHRTRSDITPSEQAVLLYQSNGNEIHRFSLDNLLYPVNELEEVVKRIVAIDGGENHDRNYVYCKELNQNGSTVDLVEQETLQHGLNILLKRISEAAVRYTRNAMALGRKQAGMVVMIHKLSVIPHDEFEGLVSYLRSVHNDDPELDSAVEQSLLESGAQSLAADESAVEALEKLTYDGGLSSDHGEESKCVICMEVLMSGSQLIRMPCSHLFHGDCIKQWLQRRNSCPLCRFSLPSCTL